MDEEMEDSYEVETVEYMFTAVEIDLDYEYDAVRFFDFTREESPAEARRAELWFETAVTYPPSPFVARLIFGQKDAFLENVNTSPKPKENADGAEIDQETYAAVCRDDEGKGLSSKGTYEYLQNSYQKLQTQGQQVPSGLTFYKHMTQDAPKAKTKSSAKPCVPRTSTLMKLTASQLAKKNQPRQTFSTRFQSLLVDKIDKSSNSAFKVEIQAAKRQKLEGGQLNKIGDMKKQMNFVHKMPKRDGTFDGNAMSAKMRITIPREPDLETTVRAQRTRKIIGKEVQDTTSTIRRFKALPLNRKILETPSLVPKRREPRVPQFHEFHLMTSERAVQHTATLSMSTVSCSDSNKKELHKCDRTSTAAGRDEIKRCTVVDAAKEAKIQSSHNFKALTLNRKIFSSKGDIGVFRNNKREITVPKEFNFHTEKRAQHNLPIDLFSKVRLDQKNAPTISSDVQLLSLASEPKQKSERPDSLPTKGSKENRWDPFPQGHQVKHEVKEKPPLNRGRQVSYGANGGKTDSRVSAISKSLGVR